MDNFFYKFYLLELRFFDKILILAKDKGHFIFNKIFMKIIIFAGGIGTRLWPLSRENSPKQFDKIFDGKSTLELAIDRVKDEFGLANVYIQTVENFKAKLMEQIPDFPEENIIIEPSRRNLGPAVCLSVLELKKRGLSGAMAILWADHLMKDSLNFTQALRAGEDLINKDPNRFIFLGEKPRFANNNLGWMKAGEKRGENHGHNYYAFEGWKYKPEASECQQMFESGQYYWNPGYFITSIEFLQDRYKNLAPEIYQAVNSGNYEQAEATHFDRAIIEKVDLSHAIIIKTNMGWSDPGTLYALKEALEKQKDDNICKGNVSSYNTKDSLLFNFEDNKILAAVGLSGMIVVNMKDALIVVPKDEVVHITDLIKQLRAENKKEFL